MKLRVLVPLLCLAASTVSACAVTPERAEVRAEPLPAEIAARLDSVRGERTEFPDFRDIPQVPDDVRTPAQWAQSVTVLKGQGAALQTWAAGNPAFTEDVAAVAAEARAELGPEGATLPPADQAAEIEALARALRARTTPPPPIPD